MEPSSVHLQKPSSPLGIFSDIHSKRFRFLLLRKTDYFHNSRIVLLNPEIYESALINLRVIIPVLQIVHSGFFIVVVASVTERVDFPMVPALLPVMLRIFPQLLYLYSTTVSPASSISAMTSFCNSKFFVTVPSDSFPISHVHAILNLSLSARFSHGADLFFQERIYL